MTEDRTPVIMGQDIAEYGGVFKITEAFSKPLAKHAFAIRPLSSRALLARLWASHLKVSARLLKCNLATSLPVASTRSLTTSPRPTIAGVQKYRRHRAPVAVVFAGPFHSLSRGVVHTPSRHQVAHRPFRGRTSALTGAIDDPNPVLFLEHKLLYRSVRGEIAQGSNSGEDLASEGGQTGLRPDHHHLERQCSTALEAAEALAESDDPILRSSICGHSSLGPRNCLCIGQKTNRALVFHEATKTGGFGGEIAQHLRHSFDYLDAPVMRVASLDTPVPLRSHLERTLTRPETL